METGPTRCCPSFSIKGRDTKRLFLRLVEGLFYSDAGSVFGLKLLAHHFHFAKDPKQVAAENFAAICGRVTAFH